MVVPSSIVEVYLSIKLFPSLRQLVYISKSVRCAMMGSLAILAPFLCCFWFSLLAATLPTTPDSEPQSPQAQNLTRTPELFQLLPNSTQVTNTTCVLLDGEEIYLLIYTIQHNHRQSQLPHTQHILHASSPLFRLTSLNIPAPRSLSR